ncbi:hypothetical protein [Sporosalibacterium faouarense]|uniref:hypothetical protein n=1 Tax=Sporosalibacterium faouarense TaxID=516123 RepID=UPI00192B6A8A|nr:hypothetical protein [Sporosalibacterium faouarense]
MDTPISRLFNLFSNWIVYVLSLLACGGLGYIIYNINTHIGILDISSWNTFLKLVKSSPQEVFLVLGSAILMLALLILLIPITLKKFGKIHIIVPALLIIGNIIGYYLGFGVIVFLINISILVLAVIIVALSIAISLPN